MGANPSTLNDAERAALAVSQCVALMQAAGHHGHRLVNALLINAASVALANGCPSSAAFATVAASTFDRLLTLTKDG